MISNNFRRLRDAVCLKFALIIFITTVLLHIYDFMVLLHNCFLFIHIVKYVDTRSKVGALEQQTFEWVCFDFHPPFWKVSSMLYMKRFVLSVEYGMFLDNLLSNVVSASYTYIGTFMRSVFLIMSQLWK